MNIITKKWAYYNDVDPKACAWARELIKAGLVAPGEVDERSITEVEPSDLKGFVQHHFFSGVLGWERALQLAGWADDRPVCTASLPCQPFSAAGAGKGVDDERHLLPTFLDLVKECRFPVIFGEQVENAISHGWADDLVNELNALNYETALAIIPAAAVGAPHIRSRLWWVANKNINIKDDTTRKNESGDSATNKPGLTPNIRTENNDENNAARLDNTENISAGAPHIRQRLYWVANSHGIGRNGGSEGSEQEAGKCARTDSHSAHNERVADVQGERHERRQDSAGENGRLGIESACGEWNNPEWIYCRDNKYRPIKPGIKPLVRKPEPSSIGLADGLPEGVVRSGDTSEPINADYTQEARVMRLKGYGNAIVPQVAASFIKAFMDL